MSKSINLGKPSGISLQEHTLHVIEQATYILDNHPFLIQKYKELTGEDLRQELINAAKYHDWGKAYPRWQNACRSDNALYKKWRVEKGLSPDLLNPEEHRQFETEMNRKGIVSAPKLMRSHLRHEFASLLYLANNNVKVSNVVKAAIAAHHGKLGVRHENRWKEDGKEPLASEGPFLKFWHEFKRLSYRTSKLSKEKLLIERYKFSVVRSLLQLADTRASRTEGEGEKASYDFEKFILKNKYDELRPVQKAAEEIAKEPIAILRAPTGSGKTYASLLWADEQINPKNGYIQKADRLVIAMPTRFTSNALSISVADQIDETGLYHSSAWFNRYGDITEREAVKEAREAHRMAKFLATPVSVCTIDHLLISLTGMKEAHHSTFCFLANSAVVFDEADFYDPFVQANIVVLLEALRTLKVPVLIMSATVPDSARQLYNIDFPIKIPAFQKSDCKKYLQWVDDIKNEITKKDILNLMLKNGSGIIYANTVTRALEYYRWFEERGITPIIYHSRFTEPSKKDIEEKLIKTLGKDAWQNNDSIPVNGIAIMTQIGEMSVNISTPIMISDLCPWDRLAQRIGRLVRFEEGEKGICYIVKPKKDGELYPAPYGEYDRKEKKWKPVDALTKTMKILIKDFNQLKEVNAEDLELFVNQLYPSAPAILGQSTSNQRNFRDLIKHNWLLLPDKYSDEDDGITEKWSSRFIPPQQTVFIYFQPRFTSFAEYQEHGLQYGVSCPIYAIEKEMRKENSKIMQSTVFIGKSEEEILVYYINKEDYDINLGFAFLYESGSQKEPSF
jgi:CRISPR-associated endonuclease/helicase Cas3